MTKNKNILKITRWRKGYGIRLSKPMSNFYSLKADDEMILNLTDKSIVLTSLKKKKLTLSERFENFVGKTEQAEFWSDAPIGKEKL